jgi:hypothetical protein
METAQPNGLNDGARPAPLCESCRLQLQPHEVTPPPAPALCNSCWFEWHEGGAAVELNIDLDDNQTQAQEAPQ